MTKHVPEATAAGGIQENGNAPTSPTKALEYALDHEGARGSRPLTRTAIARADRAARAYIAELASQDGAEPEDVDLSVWYEGAGRFGDWDACRAIEWHWARTGAARSALVDEIRAVCQ